MKKNIFYALVIFAVFTSSQESNIYDINLTVNTPVKVRLGKQITSTIILKNQGRKIVKKVVVRVVVPSGLKLGKHSKGFALKWNIDFLRPGEEKKFQYQLTTISPKIFESLAFVTVGGKRVAKKILTTKVVAPLMHINYIYGENKRLMNRRLNYEIELINRGNGVAKNVQVVATFSEKVMEYTSSTPEGKIKIIKPVHYKGWDGPKIIPQGTATVVWKLSEIAPGSKKKITLRGRARMGGKIKVELGQEVAEIEVKVPNKAKLYCPGCVRFNINLYDVKDPCMVGKEIIYMLELWNMDNTFLKKVLLENIISQEIKFVSAKGPVAYRQEKNKLIFNLPTIPPMGKLNFRIICKTVKPGVAEMVATVKFGNSWALVEREGSYIYEENK